MRMRRKSLSDNMCLRFWVEQAFSNLTHSAGFGAVVGSFDGGKGSGRNPKGD